MRESSVPIADGEDLGDKISTTSFSEPNRHRHEKHHCKETGPWAILMEVIRTRSHPLPVPGLKGGGSLGIYPIEKYFVYPHDQALPIFTRGEISSLRLTTALGLVTVDSGMERAERGDLS
jgi:hypothetical protein